MSYIYDCKDQIQHSSVYVKGSDYSKWNFSFGKNPKRMKIKFTCCLPYMLFFEDHDIEPDKRITKIVSVWEHLHMLADKTFHCIFQVYMMPAPFALPEVRSFSQSWSSSWDSTRGVDWTCYGAAVRADFSTVPQLHNSGSSVCSCTCCSL